MSGRMEGPADSLDLVRSRRGKPAACGVYLQGAELNETVFTPETYIRYVVDVEARQIIILPSDEPTENSVSRRCLKSMVKPVINLRSEEVRATFRQCRYVQVDVYKKKIVLSSYAEMESAPSESTVAVVGTVNLEGETARPVRRVMDITQLLAVKKQVEVVLSKRDLRKAVGASPLYRQMVFEFAEQIPARSRHEAEYVRKALKQIEVPLQAVSLFSGAGIMDLGFINAGWQVVFAVEIDREAAQTYRYNIGDHVLQADISTIDKNAIPKTPLMFGGSPCKGFSNANRRTHFLDNPNNRLVREFISCVQANEECLVWVLENVPQILTAGDGQFQAEIHEALSDFEITSGVVSATQYGGSQDRRRAILIGSKIGRIDLPKPEVPEGEYRTVWQAFAGLHDGIPNQRDVTALKPETRKRVSRIPPNGNWRNLPPELRERKDHHSSYMRRLDWDKPSITVVNPRKGMLLHPDEHRILSVRECARLMGVPDEFVFEGSLNAKQQQVANALPVQVATAVGRAVRWAVEQFNIRHRLAVPVLV